MAEESAWSLFFLEEDESERLLWNLQRLMRKLLLCLRHHPLTRRILRYAEEIALLVTRFAQDLQDRLPLDPVQPTRLNNNQEVDFSELQ